MAHALTIAESISFLDVEFASVGDLKDPGAGNVVVLRFRGVEDLLDLRWVRDPVAREQEALQRLRREMPVRAAVRVLRPRRVSREDALTAVGRSSSSVPADLRSSRTDGQPTLWASNFSALLPDHTYDGHCSDTPC